MLVTILCIACVVLSGFAVFIAFGKRFRVFYAGRYMGLVAGEGRGEEKGGR